MMSFINSAPQVRRVIRALLSIVLLVAALILWGSAGWIQAKAQLAQVLIERSWIASLESGRNVKPWSWADTWPVAQLRIEGQEQPMYVLAGSNGSSLAFGPALTEGDLGAAIIIHGHRDTHFSVLENIEIGKQVSLENQDGTKQRYEIVEIAIVDSSKGEYQFDQTIESLHLITCYPFNAITAGGPLRKVVIADKVSI